MKTDVILVHGEEGDLDAALGQVEKVAAYKELAQKDALHLRLLTEEMMAMMRAITGDRMGEFWIEDREGLYELHLKVNARTTFSQREQLIASATSGKNEAARGLMGRLRAFFEPVGDAPVFMGSYTPGGAMQMHGGMVWSMEDYRSQLDEYRSQKREGAQEAWDELERSVVAHVTDDVKVSIREREVEMVIAKRLA